MMSLCEIDLLGIFVSPAVICFAVALIICLMVRRLLDSTNINRFVWNRALFDLSLLMSITSLLILSLRFAGD